MVKPDNPKYEDHILMRRIDQLARGIPDLALVVQTRNELTAQLEFHDRTVEELTAKIGALERIHTELSQLCAALKVERDSLLATIKEMRKCR